VKNQLLLTQSWDGWKLVRFIVTVILSTSMSSISTSWMEVERFRNSLKYIQSVNNTE